MAVVLHLGGNWYSRGCTPCEGSRLTTGVLYPTRKESTAALTRLRSGGLPMVPGRWFPLATKLGGQVVVILRESARVPIAAFPGWGNRHSGKEFEEIRLQCLTGPNGGCDTGWVNSAYSWRNL